MKGCTELVDISNKVLAMKDVVASSPDLALASLTFSDVSCAIALGASLRIRQFVRDKLAAVDGIDTIMPKFVITTRLFGSLYSSDNAVFARVVDWFLQGGTRDDVPDAENGLADAVASDPGSKAGKKAPPKKGAEVPAPVSALASVIWIHARTQNAASRACKPCTGGAVCAEQVQFLLDSVDSAKSKERLPADLAADGAYLLMYGVQAVDGQTTQPGDIPSIVPVYSVQLSQAASAVATTIDTHLLVTEDLSAAETLLSIMLDVYNVTLGYTSLSAADADVSAGSRDALRVATDRVRHIKSARRAALSPQDKIWLCHLTKENVLQSADVFDVHSKICAARAVEVELRGLLVMLASYSCAEVERAMRFLETDIIKALKMTDQRWFANCQTTIKALDTYSPESEPVILEDLVASLGNVIDDRHLAWQGKLAQMEDSGAGVILDLQTRFMFIIDLYAKATLKIIELQKAAAVALVQLLDAANYSQVPWGDGASARVQSTGSASLLNTKIEQFLESCIGVDVGASVDKAIWADLVEMELPAGADMKAASLVALHQEAVTSCSAMLNTACSSLLEARTTVLASVNAMKKQAKRRYAYEHEVLADWGSQLRGMAAAPDAPSGRQFLQQFYFGVSDDVLNDQVASLNGENLIEIGDMHLALGTIAALSEEIASTAFPKAQLSRSNSTKDDGNTNSAAAVEKHLSVLDAFLETVVAAVKRVVLKGVPVPRSWKNLKRVTSLLANFASKSPVNADSTNILSGVASAARELILSLLFAATPCTIPVDYILRLSKSLCQPVDNSTLVRFPAAADSPTVEALLAKVKADSKLSVGWWEVRNAAEEAKFNVEHTLSVLAAISWACLEESGNVSVPTLMLSMCKCPQMHSKASFEKTLLFADAEDGCERSDSIINDGFYKALRLASRIHIQAQGKEELNEEGAMREMRMSAAAKQLDALLGAAVSLPQLTWLSQACFGGAVVAHASTFRARIGMGRRAKAAGVRASAAENGKEGGEAAPLKEEVEEVWEPMDGAPAGTVVPVAGAWALAGALRGKSFALSKFCKS